MKKFFAFFLGIFVLLFAVNFISAEDVNYSYSHGYEGVQITTLKYDSYPVNPGEYFEVWFQVSLGSSVDYVKFELLDSFPFSVDESEDSVREYVGANSREIVMHYKVRASENAVEGLNELKLKIITSKSYEGDIVSSFDIYVADAQTDFDLVLQDSTSSQISLAIANVGKNTANSMIVRIPSQEGYVVSGTSGQMVGNLDSGDYTIVSFEVSEIRGGDNVLDIQIDYTDSIGERRSVTKEISFSSGSVLENMTFESEEGSMPQDFERMLSMGNFPGQKKAKWPYFLAVGLILIFVGFFVYGKYKRQIKTYIRDKKKRNNLEKEKTNSFPDWMVNDSKKVKKG